MIEKDLQSLGLHEKEAKVYMASLELGQATVQKIATKAEIKRPTTYFIIENLMSHGLMSSFYKEKKQYFVAEMPERIFDIIQKERKNLDLREEQFRRLLPELRSLNNRMKNKPVVKYYEGKEGILTMAKEHLLATKNQESWNIFSRDIIEEYLSADDLASLKNIRLDNDIESKAIYTRKAGALLPSKKNDEFVRVSEKEFPITCDIAFFEDKVRIASFKNRMVGVVIEDREIAQSLRSLFRFAWKWVNRNKKDSTLMLKTNDGMIEKNGKRKK